MGYESVGDEMTSLGQMNALSAYEACICARCRRWEGGMCKGVGIGLAWSWRSLEVGPSPTSTSSRSLGSRYSDIHYHIPLISLRLNTRLST